MNCGKEFESKRADARYCSDKCRKQLSRTNSPDKIISDIIPDEPPEVLSGGKYNPEYLPGGAYYTGICKQGNDGNWYPPCELSKRIA